MTWTDSTAVVLTHVSAAGAALTIPITDVAISALLPKGRCIRMCYGGETDPPMVPRQTLTGQLIGELTFIAAFWPISNLDEAEMKTVEDDIVALKNQIRTRISLDKDLGGTCKALILSDVDVGTPEISGTRYRVAAWDLETSYQFFTQSL
jgi:hypothetical protein